MNPNPRKKPTFVWQGGLIVAPVLLLAAVGAFSVWQDSTLARHEATERARSIAEDLVPRLRAELLTASGAEPEFSVDSSGRLVDPPPCRPVPIPKPFNLSALTSQQATLWHQAETAEANAAEPSVAAQAYSRFLETNPPRDFAAAARYAAALWQARAGDIDSAASQMAVLLQEFPDAVGQSGVPLQPLAEVKLLEWQRRGARSTMLPELTLEGVCSNLLANPTPLTGYLLRVLEQAQTTSGIMTRWRRRWANDEAARELYRAAEPQLEHLASASYADLDRVVAVPSATNLIWPTAGSGQWRPFWFTAPGVEPAAYSQIPFSTQVPLMATAQTAEWLAVPVQQMATGATFVCRSADAVGRAAGLVGTTTRHLPDYLGVGFEVAGKRVTWPGLDLRVWHEVHYMGGKGAGQVRKEYSGELATTILASAGSAADHLTVSVYLTSPSGLFKYQRARTFWFATLIAAASLAALVGLIAAYRAFQRQLRLSDMKSDFVSSVSHELRAPIASVRLMAESLERGKVADATRQREYFTFIGQECRRLSSLIENVLDFSRIEQGRKEYEFEPTDLPALVQYTVQFMQTYATERDVTLELLIQEPAAAEGSFQVPADGKALQQAVVNLIDNAIKHSPKGGAVKVGLELGETPAANGTPPAPRILLWVEDAGPGIPAAEHDKIFERFYRRGSELRRETQGVGIGLSIVKHIVEAHGGQVRVRSEAGQGSRFTIELPAATSEISPTRLAH